MEVSPLLAGRYSGGETVIPALLGRATLLDRVKRVLGELPGMKRSGAVGRVGGQFLGDIAIMASNDFQVVGIGSAECWMGSISYAKSSIFKMEEFALDTASYEITAATSCRPRLASRGFDPRNSASAQPQKQMAVPLSLR